MTIGPVEYLILGFPGNKFTGEIVPELAKLIESGLVRIIDLTFISKDADRPWRWSSTTPWRNWPRLSASTPSGRDPHRR